MDNTNNKNRKYITVGEMLPYLNLASAIIRRAELDVKHADTIHERSEAKYFLNESAWGKYLYDSVSEFQALLEKTASNTKEIRL